MSSHFVAGAEVDKLHLAVTFIHQITEEQVQRTIFASLLTHSDILEVGHLEGLKNDATAHHLLVAAHQEQADIPGKTLHQQLHFLHRMHGRGVVMDSQYILQ